LSNTGMYFDLDTNSVSSTPRPGSDVNIFDTYGTSTYNGQHVFYHSVSFFGPNKAGNNTLATLTTPSGLTMRLAPGGSIGPTAPSGSVFGRQNDLVNQYCNYTTGAKV